MIGKNYWNWTRINILKASVVDLWHLGTDPDLQIRTTDLRIHFQIRTWLFWQWLTRYQQKIQLFNIFFAYYFLKINLHSVADLDLDLQIRTTDLRIHIQIRTWLFWQWLTRYQQKIQLFNIFSLITSVNKFTQCCRSGSGSGSQLDPD
jgi:hypothetical protein